MTEEDLPKSLEEPRTSENGQTKDDLDKLIRNLYFDRVNYPNMIYKKGYRQEFPNRTTAFYQCAYKHCGWHGLYASTLKHMETEHYEDPDIETMTPVEWGLKNLYRGEAGIRGKFTKGKYQPADGIWRCPYPNCDFKGSKYPSCTRHHVEHIHHNIKYPCPNEGCAQIFSNKDYLSMHVRNVHDNIKAYTCDFCDQPFKTTHGLRCHRMIHTGERPFTCPGCGKGFIQRTPWKRHMANVCRVQPPDEKKK